jgi:hypothetical protein
MDESASLSIDNIAVATFRKIQLGRVKEKGMIDGGIPEGE